MPIEPRDISAIVNPLVLSCFDAFNAACDANPNRSSNAIIMTALDMLTAALVPQVAATNVRGVGVSEIMLRHTKHVFEFIEAQEHTHG